MKKDYIASVIADLKWDTRIPLSHRRNISRLIFVNSIKEATVKYKLYEYDEDVPVMDTDLIFFNLEEDEVKKIEDGINKYL